MPKNSGPFASSDLLDAAYRELQFDRGTLLSAKKRPDAVDAESWVDNGDWRVLAEQVGAERLFFVGRDPVVVFARTDDSDEAAVRRLYESIWCMSRPQILFLASPGKLSAFDLTKPPPKATEAIEDRDRLIAVATSMAEIQEKLHDFHRERIEAGSLFAESRFRDSSNRSDRALIRDLRIMRRQLDEVPTKGVVPSISHLHSLIGRAIFIRYLEDRDILRPAYFEKVAKLNAEWLRLLDEAPEQPALVQRISDLKFLRVLRNKDFTYALFNQLARDFNGDIFPIDSFEQECITEDHLNQLHNFFIGTPDDRQQELFFFAYRFDVIPIELISTIYEEFYNERIGKDRNQGSHYTPPALVEFVLAQTLTETVLASQPRVIDPACGSGIFLVESYRRMIRFLCVRQGGKRVSRKQLLQILRDQIAGIDINEEAVRVAAFSLYLAFLHYQEPREINDERRLPYLKWVDDPAQRQVHRAADEQTFDILLYANAFDVVAGNCSDTVAARFGAGKSNVVVGNPPWGSPRKDDLDGRSALKTINDWCSAKLGRPIGQKELSQAFLHLTNSLLCEGGRAGLLVSSGVLFKQQEKSRAFRRVWLSTVRIEQIVNFAHVRHVFFSGPTRETKGIAPFISVVFEKRQGSEITDQRFEYWSAKRTSAIQNTQAVILNRGDMHWLSQQQCSENDTLWKTYWWGGHRDERLIRKIAINPRIGDVEESVPSTKVIAGRGFEVTSSGQPSGWLKEFCELPPRFLQRYGPQPLDGLRPVPNRVHRKGNREVYSGRRLLVGRGIKSEGHIISRFETETYCFRNSIHGLKFEGLAEWQEAIILAIFWSSLARYYYFLTSGSWGFWHDEIHLEHVKQMPIRWPEDERLRARIVSIVHDLQNFRVSRGSFKLDHEIFPDEIDILEAQLDAAIFELFELNEAECDLITELCNVGLELLYNNQRSNAVRPVVSAGRIGSYNDVATATDGLAAYLQTYIRTWTKEVPSPAEFVWQVHSPPSGAPLIAVSFTLRQHSENNVVGNESEEWAAVLTRMAALSPTDSSRVFVDTYYRFLSPHEALFIKRNERRFWTRTAAREDAESALAQLLNQVRVQKPALELPFQTPDR